MKKIHLLSMLLGTFLLMMGALSVSETTAAGPTVSGQIVNGLRILPVPADGQNVKFTVYRGDYIKFELPESAGPSALAIPQLNIHQTVAGDLNQAPYFKMKQTGTYAFTLGNVRGHIHVRDYRQEKYAEVSAADAADIIARNPQALQLRFLSTLTEIATEKNSTIVFPLPIELLKAFDFAKKKTEERQQ